MSITPPKIILRLGSHAEKDYFEKLAKSLDGIMFGANLIEITPAATCSLIFSLRTKRGGSPLPFYLDPMTYCFGAYIDPDTGRKRSDLEALKSERVEKRGSKNKIKSVKESYSSLADRLGPAFKQAVNGGQTCRAMDPSEIPASSRDAFCKGVVEYQLHRVHEILNEDELMKAAFGDDGTPAAIFAPYFFIHDLWAVDGLKAAMDLAARTVALRPGVPVHAVVCASQTILGNAAHVKFLIDELPKTKAAGVWLWFEGFDEFKAPPDRLVALRNIVRGLNGRMDVFNLHGGYYSLLLSHDGLTGISHGVGYGEQKPVAQVIGAAAPTVRYYLPPISKRIGVPDVQRCFEAVGIKTAADFFSKVCDCQICKGVIGTNVARFAGFGEMHRANIESKKDTQTPAAAKMCRFHFLINRFKERMIVAKLNAGDRSQHIADKAAPWRDCYPLRPHLNQPGTDGYLEFWAEALR